MVKVTLNNQTLAESDETIVVEGNHYFPPSSVNRSLFTESSTQCVFHFVRFGRLFGVAGSMRG